MFLFIADRNVGRMIASPLELNVVSKVDGLVAIGSKSLETFFDKSRIEMFVFKPASICFEFASFFFGHRFLVLYSLTFDILNFVADGLGHGVVF